MKILHLPRSVNSRGPPWVNRLLHSGAHIADSPTPRLLLYRFHQPRLLRTRPQSDPPRNHPLIHNSSRDDSPEPA
jgi:hypothetical protein